MNVIDRLERGLIVSCQPWNDPTTGRHYPDDPLHGPAFMSMMAKHAEMGGAVGIRANGTKDIKAIKKVTSLPLIGINKIPLTGSKLSHVRYITPTFSSAEEIVRAGADIVAIDATFLPRPGASTVPELIKDIKEKLKVAVMADISVLEEGVEAAKAGADLVATTRSGYTPYSLPTEGADIELVSTLAKEVVVPVICEGRVRTPEEAVCALKAGAYAVVVGYSITMPRIITGRFVELINKFKSETFSRKECLRKLGKNHYLQ